MELSEKDKSIMVEEFAEVRSKVSNFFDFLFVLLLFIFDSCDLLR